MEIHSFTSFEFQFVAAGGSVIETTARPPKEVGWQLSISAKQNRRALFSVKPLVPKTAFQLVRIAS